MSLNIYLKNNQEFDHNVLINVDEPCIPAFHESKDIPKVLPSGEPICVDPITTNNREFEKKSRRIKEIPKMENIISRARRIIRGDPAQEAQKKI